MSRFKNAHVIPPGGIEAQIIGPSHGIEEAALIPSHGPMRGYFGGALIPSGGMYIDVAISTSFLFRSTAQ